MELGLLLVPEKQGKRKKNEISWRGYLPYLASKQVQLHYNKLLHLEVHPYETGLRRTREQGQTYSTRVKSVCGGDQQLARTARGTSTTFKTPSTRLRLTSVYEELGTVLKSLTTQLHQQTQRSAHP